MNSAQSIFKNIAIFIVFTIPFLTIAAPLYQPGETLNPACLPTNTDCAVATSTNAFATTSSDYWLTRQYALPNLVNIGSSTGTTTTLGDALFSRNVGIGTTTPLAKLDIFNTSSSATAPLFSIASSTNGTGTSTTFYVNANGNVGIGTSNPLSKLQIQTAGVTFTDDVILQSSDTFGGGSFAIKNSNGSALMRMSADSTSGINTFISTLGGLGVRTGNAAIDGQNSSLNFVIDNTGNVGIGTTSP